MFAFNTNANASPLYDFNSFANYLGELQKYQQQQQLEQSRPKIVKKVETEDKYQIQIFKKYGNFDTYEVRVLKNNSFSSNKLINLVIESRSDQFRKVFQFNLNDIEVSEIDWEYFDDENVLVLNIPKKVKYCTDDITDALSSLLFGYNPRASSPYYCTQQYQQEDEIRREAEQKARLEVEERLRREVEEKARREAEVRVRKEAEARARREAEVRAREAEARARKEAEARARREAEVRAREAEARARKEAEARARREAETKAREAETRKQAESNKDEPNTRSNQQQQQQEFLTQLFGSHPLFSQFSPFFNQFEPQPVRQPQPKQPAKQYSEPPHPVPTKSATQNSTSVSQIESNNNEETIKPTSYETDSESIDSEAETESVPSSPTAAQPIQQSSRVLKAAEPSSKLDSHLSALHKHPSIEEVEDEEFVMFRKKFGQ